MNSAELFFLGIFSDPMLFVGVGCGEFHHLALHFLLLLRRFSLSFPVSTST
jgi:hypothetical protein